MGRSFALLIIAAAAAPASAQTAALSFEQAVRKAPDAAEAIEVARAEVERAEAGLTTARSGYLPTVNGSASYIRTLKTQFEGISFGGGMAGSGTNALPFGQPNAWNVGVQVAQPLFDGFRTHNAMKQARADVRASQLGVQASRAQSVLDATQAYFDAVLADRQIEITAVTLEQAEQTFKETTLGFQQGATPEFDVVRAEVARDNQRTLLVQFKAQRDVAYVRLRQVVGLRAGLAITLSTKLELDDVATVASTARDAAGIVATTRVPIAQAQENVDALGAAVEVARSRYYPTIAAVSDLGFVTYEPHPLQGDWFTNWTAGVSLTLPIFDGMRRQAEVRSTRAALAGARARLDLTREVSDVEVAQAAAAVAARSTQLEQTTRTVQQARRAYQIAELRFQQGASTHLELVDARVQLEQALLGQARAARDLRVARVIQELLPNLPLGVASGGPVTDAASGR